MIVTDLYQLRKRFEDQHMYVVQELCVVIVLYAHRYGSIS